MDSFAEYLNSLESPEHRARMAEILDWVSSTFPQLGKRIAWNQPMFTDHGTFIIGFSVSKNHTLVSPEVAGIDRFADAIAKAGYTRTKMLFRIPLADKVDYDLLKEMIEFNIEDKADQTNFWR